MPDTGRRSQVEKPKRTTPAPKLNPLERYKRGRQIAEMRARDKPVAWREIATAVGMSQSGAKEAYAQFLSWEEPLHDPNDAVQQAIDAATILLHTSLHSIDATAVNSPEHQQAQRTAGAALDRWINVMQRTGRLPRSLTAPRVSDEMQIMLREVARLLERHAVPDEALRDVLVLAESRLGRANAIDGRELPSAA